MLSDIFFFNPTCEPAIANGSPYYTPPARLRKFESDLGYLPSWLGERNDQVLVRGAVSAEFEDKMKNFGFGLPTILNLDDALTNQNWINQPKGKLVPWGWSPAVYQLFREVIPTCNDEFQRSEVADWQPNHKNLYSRITAIGLLDKMLQNNPKNWFPDRSELPVVCSSLAQISEEIIRYQSVVVKTPWSSSGRGLLLFPNIDSRKKNDEILSGMLNQQGFVTVEPWLEKVMDLSYQFYSFAGRIEYKGRTIFETDQKGRYVRNLLGDSKIVSDEVAGFLDEHNSEVVSMLLESLSGSNYSTIYEGWIGVDALIFRTSDGVLRFHPMIEINGRYTMGAIALKISEHLAPGSSGFMQIYYSKSTNFQSFSQKQEAEKPLIRKDGKIVRGFMPLTPPLAEHHFGAYIEVTPPRYL